MTEATESVRYGEVTTAVRTASIDGISVEQGDTIGLLDGKMVATGDDPGDVLLVVVSKAEPERGGIVTVYAGDPVSGEAAQAAADALEEALSGVDIELVSGGQPHYHYLFSVE
jgi:dihydroxyacetone kinase-like predicted kinase